MLELDRPQASPPYDRGQLGTNRLLRGASRVYVVYRRDSALEFSWSLPDIPGISILGCGVSGIEGREFFEQLSHTFGLVDYPFDLRQNLLGWASTHLIVD